MQKQYKQRIYICRTTLLGSSETIYDCQQVKMLVYGHGMVWLFDDPLVYQKSARRNYDVNTLKWTKIMNCNHAYPKRILVK